MNHDRVRCNNIPYRKGFIEVSPNIHEGLVNLETWDIHVDQDISDPAKDKEIPDEAFIANTELELTVSEAEDLVVRLLSAIEQAKNV